MEIRHIVNEGFFIFGENGDELAKLTYRKEGEKLFFNYKIVPVCSYIVKKFESGKYDDLKA